MLNITSLKEEITKVDEEILNLVCRRWELVKEAKSKHGIMVKSTFESVVQSMQVTKKEESDTITKLIHEFMNKEKSASHSKTERKPSMLYSRDYQKSDTVITINGESIGGVNPQLMMGPCAVESYEQVKCVANELHKKGVHFLRGGAFKPRTSPYDFQGLGIEGLKILSKVAKEYNMSVISEIMSVEDLEEALPYLDVVQVGARNMHNFSLLSAVGKIDKPILLKRGLSATIKEFKLAAEYILIEGNRKVILCERGIRSFEPSTRNTLDLSAVPILKQETHLPVIVDVTHSTGRKDLLTATAKGALAVGADGIMAEVHPNPEQALSDSKQQMNFNELEAFYSEVQRFIRMNSYVQVH